MLTFTYSLVALSVEQKKARGILAELRQHFQRSAKEPGDIDQSHFESALEQLATFDESYHRRNVELYVIPAVRKVTREADTLLNELESISSGGVQALQSVRGRLRHAFGQGEAEIKELCFAMTAYCDNLLERLAREEKELFPIARRVISNEGWFDLASQFMSHEAETHAYKPSAASAWHPVRRRQGPLPLSL